ncbi:MAG: DUF2975 domain-containing protein [Candidatus Eisenbacteria bacterium]
MSTSLSSSAALPFTHAGLRLLIALNWVMAPLILTLLLLLPHEQWILQSFHIPSSPEGDRLVGGMRLIALIGLASIPLHYMALKRLLAIVETVRLGDPFVAANATRLQGIAWVLLVLQVLSMVVDGIAKAVAIPGHPLQMGAGFSVNGWLAVILTFLLARVFAEGTRMRDDLAGTV